MADRIGLSGMVFYGHHGVRAEERSLGQRLVVDVELERDLATAGRSDDLADTSDYSAVYRIVGEVVEGPSHNLLERLADEVAHCLLDSFAVTAVRVRVSKPQPPIKDAVVAEAWVQIERHRRS